MSKPDSNREPYDFDEDSSVFDGFIDIAYPDIVYPGMYYYHYPQYIVVCRPLTRRPFIRIG